MDWPRSDESYSHQLKLCITSWKHITHFSSVILKWLDMYVCVSVCVATHRYITRFGLGHLRPFSSLGVQHVPALNFLPAWRRGGYGEHTAPCSHSFLLFYVPVSTPACDGPAEFDRRFTLPSCSLSNATVTCFIVSTVFHRVLPASHAHEMTAEMSTTALLNSLNLLNLFNGTALIVILAVIQVTCLYFYTLSYRF